VRTRGGNFKSSSAWQKKEMIPCLELQEYRIGIAFALVGVGICGVIIGFVFGYISKK
jgi:hypothetical protein